MAKKEISTYDKWRWKYLSGVDREGLDDPQMSHDIAKAEEERLRDEAIKNGADPKKVDANLLYLQKKYGPHSR